jgi:hypothetical protein
MNNARKLLLLAAPALLASPSVLAKEDRPDQFLNGAENFMAGALPPPGSYFINYLGYYQGDYRDNNGDKLPVEVKATFDALRFIYVSNYKIFGGDWAVHAIVPLVYQKLETPNPAFGNDWVFGLGDITIDPLIIGWHFPPDWHVTVGLDIYLPTGKYSSTDPTDSIGANYYSFEPIFSFTYLNQSGFEISAKLMYNIKTRNDDTDYQSGDEFHMDYLIGQHFGPWAVGLGGYYLTQTTNDELNGQKVDPDGNRGQVFAFGPAVKYDHQGMSFVGSWNYETDVENRFQGNKFLFKFITAF